MSNKNLQNWSAKLVCKTGHTGITASQIYSRLEQLQWLQNNCLVYFMGYNIYHVMHVKGKSTDITLVHNGMNNQR